MSAPADELHDVSTTSHDATDPLGKFLEELADRLRREFSLELVGIVTNSVDGVVILRAKGVPIGFSAGVLEGMRARGFLHDFPRRPPS